MSTLPHPNARKPTIIDERLRQAQERWNRLSPEEQAEERREQDASTAKALATLKRVKHEGAKTPEAKADWRDGGFSAGDLCHMQFPDVMWIVPALFPEGLTLLAGKPKIGKSWLALDLALGIAAGTFVLGGVKVAGGDVLYCALEDNKRRLQKRIRKIWGNDEWPQRLRLQLSWKRLDKGGIDDLAEWLDSVPAGRLIILDTLAGVRPVKTNNGYTEDYGALEELHRLANDRGVAVVVLHHTRKMDAEDPVDQVSGTLGLAGCADTVMVLNRIASGTTLYGRGRDIEEFERAVEFSRETCRWRILGNAEDVKKAESQKRVLSALGERTESMTPKELAAATGMPEATISTALFRMLPIGDVVREGRGKYRLPGASPETPQGV